MRQQLEFRDATMALSDGTTLTIPAGIVMVDERTSGYDPYLGVKGGGGVAPPQMYYNHQERIVEFTLVPKQHLKNIATYEVSRGHTNMIVSLNEISAVAGAIVTAVIEELDERDGLDIDGHPDRDDIIDSLIEMVTAELRDMK